MQSQWIKVTHWDGREVFIRPQAVLYVQRWAEGREEVAATRAGALAHRGMVYGEIVCQGGAHLIWDLAEADAAWRALGVGGAQPANRVGLEVPELKPSTAEV